MHSSVNSVAPDVLYSCHSHSLVTVAAAIATIPKLLVDSIGEVVDSVVKPAVVQ